MMSANKETRVWETLISDQQHVRSSGGPPAGASTIGSHSEPDAKWQPRVRVVFVIGTSLALWAIIFTVLLWTIN
jgi:hypothetical protein